MEAEVTNIKKNILGTITVFLKVKPMRKAQGFSIYPINKTTKKIILQSDTRIVEVNLDGEGKMSESHQNGAHFHNLNTDRLTLFNFSKKDWQQIVEYIGVTESDSEGGYGISTDNSGAKSIFNRENE